MKLGILADIHEQVKQLRECLAVLRDHGADQIVVLGDVFELGRNLDATVELLTEAEAIGVWGNHDFGFCVDPTEALRRKYSPKVWDFMGNLKPKLEIDGCLFTHVEPWLDARKIEDLWYFDGVPDSAGKLARTFKAVPNQVMFVGHFHRWLAGTPDGVLEWDGSEPIRLDTEQRHLVVIHGVCDWKCATFDTKTNMLTPFDLRPLQAGGAR